MARLSSWLDVTIGLTLVAGVLLACASSDPVFRLSSASPDSTSFWVQGRHVVTAVEGGVGVAVAYERTNGSLHVFRTAVANHSRETWTFEPSGIDAVMTYEAVAVERLRRAPDSVRGTIVPSRDPESELLRVDVASERQEAEARNDALVNGLLLTLDAAADVTDELSGGRTPEEREADAEADRAFFERAEAQSLRNAQALSALERERLQWSNVALRRTTLRPGTKARGLVYVPVEEEARTVVLRIPVGDRVFHVPFRQTKYETEPDNPYEDEGLQ